MAKKGWSKKDAEELVDEIRDIADQADDCPVVKSESKSKKADAQKDYSKHPKFQKFINNKGSK